MKQKGVALIPILSVITILAVLGGIFFLTKTAPIKKDANSGALLNNNGTCFVFSQAVKPPAQSADITFKSPPTKIDAIDKITPGSQTGDPRFTYLWIKDGKEVPVFAPADGVLVKINYKKRVDIGNAMSDPDYDLTFLTDCKTLYQINHVTKPTPEIAALRPNNDPHQLTKGASLREQDTLPKQNITVRAGTELGTTTGTPNAHNFDFGVFVDGSAVCPYLKLEEAIRSDWLGLFKGNPCEVSGTY